MNKNQKTGGRSNGESWHGPSPTTGTNAEGSDVNQMGVPALPVCINYIPNEDL